MYYRNGRKYLSGTVLNTFLGPGNGWSDQYYEVSDEKLQEWIDDYERSNGLLVVIQQKRLPDYANVVPLNNTKEETQRQNMYNNEFYIDSSMYDINPPKIGRGR